MPGPVFLRGERVTLHTIEPGDAPFLAEVINDPEVRRGVAAAYPMSEADEREWIETIDERNPEGVHLVVCADDEPVGTIGVTDVVSQWRSAELGYMIAPEAWNQGYATDAVRIVADYAFDEIGLAKLTARVFETNDASARVLEKVGFAHEGTSREHALVDGERVDLRLYGLRPGDR